MKNCFFYLIPIIVLMASCSKDNAAAPTQEPKLPQGVSTAAISQITQNDAISGGSILNDGGASTTARGIV